MNTPQYQTMLASKPTDQFQILVYVIKSVSKLQVKKCQQTGGANIMCLL